MNAQTKLSSVVDSIAANPNRRCSHQRRRRRQPTRCQHVGLCQAPDRRSSTPLYTDGICGSLITSVLPLEVSISFGRDRLLVQLSSAFTCCPPFVICSRGFPMKRSSTSQHLCIQSMVAAGWVRIARNFRPLVTAMKISAYNCWRFIFQISVRILVLISVCWLVGPTGYTYMLQPFILSLIRSFFRSVGR